MSSANRLKASIVDLTFIIWAVAVPLVLRNRLLNADGDFPRHLTMGRFILEGGPFQIDSFAHTKTGPFLTTEWLSQVSYALAWAAGDLAGVAVLCGLIIGSAYALAVLLMRRAGVDPLLAYVTGTAAAVFGAPHFVARPHLFTFLGLAVLMHLAVSRAGRKVWLFVPLFAVWANFHAGFVLGLAILVAWAAGDLAEARMAGDAAARRAWLERARFHALGAGLGLLAAAMNPMGFGLLFRIRRILGNDYLLGMTAEFAPLNFHMLYGKMVLVLLIAIMAGFALRRERPAFPHLAVVLLTLAGALYATRNAPLFALVSLPLLAIEFDASWRRLGWRWVGRIRDTFETGERAAVRGRLIPWAAALLVVLGLTRGAIAGTRIVPDEFDGDKFPVAAVHAARAAGLEGRVFNWFIWGGYMLHAWPEQKVFIDGMTDFFGNDLMRSYLNVEYLEPGWEEELRRYDVSIVLVPPDTRLVPALLRTGEWAEWYRDRTAVILRRGGEAPDRHPAGPEPSGGAP